MNKLVLICLLIALPFLSIRSASAYTITIPGGVGGMPVYGGEYTGPIGARLDGVAIAGGITCVDFNSITLVPNTVGFAVTLETLSPVNLTNARFLKDDINQLLTYEKAAWLNTQIHLLENQAQIGSIQFAMWELFSTNPATKLTATQQTSVQSWLDKVNAEDLSRYDFSSVVIYTPTDRTRNQEFISGGATPVPEPGSMMLLGFGLFGLAVYGKRRSNKNG